MPSLSELKRQADALAAEDRLDDAIAIYAQLIDAFDDAGGELDIALFEQAGDVLLNRGDLGAALDWFEMGVDRYIRAGLRDDAIALGNKILRHQAGRTSVHVKLATLNVPLAPSKPSRVFRGGAKRPPAAKEPGDVFGRMKGGELAADDDTPPTTGVTPRIDGVAARAPSPDVVADIFASPTAMPTDVQDVLLGASAPRSAGRGDEFTARFVAYLAEDEVHVREVLTDLSERSTSHLGVRSMSWSIGTDVAVTVSGRGLEVSPATRSFVWKGNRILLEFDVLVGDSARAGTTCVLKYDVAVAGMLVTTIRCDLAITAERGLGRLAERPSSVPRTAFASYASQDRDRVADRVAALSAVAKMDVFLDHLSLVAGERWQERLNSEILSREVFLLFWSPNARASQWVEWEWKTALRERGLEVILPQPLESVDLAPVPAELAELHFGDHHLLLRSSGRVQQKPPSDQSPPTS